MLRKIKIENYKSINDVTLDLGRLNVFIGENGAGKSNILEAIALAGAAAAEKLDNEFLIARGIRVTAPDLMRSAFNYTNTKEPIKISVQNDENSQNEYSLNNDNEPYSTWEVEGKKRGEIEFDSKKFEFLIKNFFDADKIEKEYKNLKNLDNLSKKILVEMLNFSKEGGGEKSVTIRVEADKLPEYLIQKKGGVTDTLKDFVVYSPENSSLRILEKEGQIQPLGVNGEGLLKLLKVLSTSDDKKELTIIKDGLRLLGWFEDFKIASDVSEDVMNIRDRFLDQKLKWFDQRSANEGFLFAAFYFSLFCSRYTPKFFAVDNIDASLNPKLCMELIKRIANLAKDNDKQALLTTHNPAILDGLDINDPEQRLFIVSRDRFGHTKVRRFEKLIKGRELRLSDLFMKGLLGGLPKGF